MRISPASGEFITTAVAFLVVGSLFWSSAVPAGETNYAECMECHEGIERISPNHDFPCAACHLDSEDRSRDPLTSHDHVIRNPSDPSNVTRFCMPCHRREIERLEKSLHSTMAGIINQTRYLWGAQPSPNPPIYGVRHIPRPLPVPDPSVYPDTPEVLVDDFLRRRCLRCHIHTRGPEARGLYRATGCAACHVIYGEEGRYEGGDPAIDPKHKGYPLRHQFTARIPPGQCIHCHNQNHVGSDYIGLFERDYSSTYRNRAGPETGNRLVYGLDHHILSQDIHAERGMWCVDCHGKEEVMGDGNLYGFQMAVPKRACSDCHGGFNRSHPDASISAARLRVPKVPNGGCSQWEFVSKNQRRVHPLPIFSSQSVAHSIQNHAMVRCSACHSQWSYQDYGMSVIRIDGEVEPHWRHLAAQGDPYIQRLLKDLLERPGTAVPVSKDWVDGNQKRGIWLQGWRFRRWEPMPLGKDHTGRAAILRPLGQYLVSYTDGWGNPALDSVVPERGDRTVAGWAFMPYVPHTISPAGRSCDRCHRSRVAAGLGMEGELTEDTRLTVPAPPAIGQMRLLNERERQILLHPSERFQKKRMEALIGIRSAGKP